MKRIYHVGIAQNDKRAKTIVENLGEVNGIKLIPTTISPAGSVDGHLKPDVILSHLNSYDEIVRGKYFINGTPVVLVGEFFNKKGDHHRENFYFSSPNHLNLSSILKALFKGLENVKVELRNGAVINLISSLKGSRIEKLLPTGNRVAIPLSFKEGVILKEIFKDPGEIIPYERFLELGIKKENIPVYISRLRKIVSELENFLVIKSLRNKGYFIYYGL